MSLLILANLKNDSYDLILVIIDRLTMIYYKLVKIIIDPLGLTKVIINMVICYYGVLESIVN